MESSSIFRWKIEHFSVTASRQGPENFLNSDDFTLPNNLKFCLQFEHTTSDDGFKHHSALCLMPKNLGRTNSATLKFKFSIENGSGTIIHRLSGENTHEFKGVEGYRKRIYHNYLYPRSERTLAPEDDVIVICCEIKIVNLAKNILSGAELKFREQIYSSYVVSNNDKCLIKVGKKEFNVSKCILMSYSKVFDRMFTTDMKESKTGTIKVDDATPEIVESFLQYLYLGRIEHFEEMAEELFVLSDKYEVSSLMEECVEVLSKSSTKDNILDRLKLAFMHSSEEFRQNLLNYACDEGFEGNFQQILMMNEWKELMNVNKVLTDEITTAVFKQIWNK